MNLQCTKKALKLLKIKELNHTFVLENVKDINNWHCNIIEHDDGNSLLITNDKTLFSFFFLNIEDYEIEELDFVLRERIFKMMLNLDFPQKEFEVILNNIENITYTKSSNRSVLASMTHIILEIEYYLYERNESELDINIKINNTPHKKLEYSKAMKVFRLLLQNKA